MIRDTAICSAITIGVQLVLPAWWLIICIPLVYMFFTGHNGFYGFLIGALSAGIVWEGYSWYLYFTSGSIIADRISQMIGIDYAWLLVIISGLIAFIAGGIAGMTGSLLRPLFKTGSDGQV